MHIIHVNTHVIKSNARHGNREAPLTLKRNRSEIVARGQEILIQSDPPVLVRYEPDNPLSCGARVWIETDAPVGVRDLGSNTFKPATVDARSVDASTVRPS